MATAKRTAKTATKSTAKPIRSRRKAPKSSIEHVAVAANNAGEYVAKSASTASDYMTKAANNTSEYIAKNPWAGVALGVGVVALGWTTRRMWMPIAAAGALNRMLPGSKNPGLQQLRELGDRIDLDQIGRQLNALKPKFMQ